MRKVAKNKKKEKKNYIINSPIYIFNIGIHVIIEKNSEARRNYCCNIDG